MKKLLKLLSILFCWPHAMFAATDSTSWINTESWPYEIILENPNNSPIVFVIEQAGVDLVLELSDGKLVNSPVGSIGPEFLFLDPNDRMQVSLKPFLTNVPHGSFRVNQIDQLNLSEIEIVKQLQEAAISYGTNTPDGILRACNVYNTVAFTEELTAMWKKYASQMSVSCNLNAGIENVPELLNQLIAPQSNFFSIPSYYSSWLIASNARVNDSYIASTQLHETLLEEVINSFENIQTAELKLAVEIDLAEVKNQLGGAQMMSGWTLGNERGEAHLRNSQANLEDSISIASKHGHGAIIGSAYDNLAGLNFVRGNDSGVIENLLLAKSFLETIGDPRKIITVLGNIGDYHKKWGETRAALEAYHQAISIIDELGWEERYYDTWHNIGRLYFDLGDLERAKDATEKASSSAERSGREWRKFVIDVQLAEILTAQGEYEAARNLNLTLLEFFRQEGWTPFRINVQSYLSNTERLLGNNVKALELSQEVVDRLGNGDRMAGIEFAPIYANHARILFGNRDDSGAFSILDDAILNVITDPADKIDLLATKVEIYQALGNTDAAIAQAEETFQLIESQQVQLDTARLGPFWSGHVNEIFTSHIEYLLSVENSESYKLLAFSLSERAQATNLRLRRRNQLQVNNEFNERARNEWIQVQNQLREMQSDISSEQDALKYERELEGAAERYFSAHGVNSSNDLRVLSLAEIQSELDTNSIAIQFIYGPNSVWRFDITSDGFSAQEIGETNVVSALIDAGLYELTNPNSNSTNNLRLLSETLLKNLPALPESGNFYIATSGKIGSLPFSSLYLNENYLVENSTLTFTPSLSEFFIESENTPNEYGLELALLADPAFSEPPRLESFQDFDDQFRSWSTSLERLPYSAQEALEVGKLFKEGANIIFTGPEASQDNFFSEDFRNAKIVHVATHGYFNEELPELIGFATAKTSADDDGFVSLAEISANSFAAQLVVISACDTARGYEIPGEGAMSLSRSFLAQGADSVVSTLWPVSDAATAIFMKEFYFGLKELNLSLPESLKRSQNELRKIPRFRNPFYWSAYVFTSANQESLDIEFTDSIF